MKRCILLTVCMAVGIAGCDGAGGVSVGTGVTGTVPQQPVSFQMRVAGGASTAAKRLLRPAAVPNAAEIDAATAVVESFRFDLAPPLTCADYAARLTGIAEDWRRGVCEPEETGVSLRFQGPFVFDLTRETAEPDTSRLVLPTGSYDRVRIRLEADADAGPGAEGVSLLVYGRLVDGGVDPFMLALDLEEELEYRAAEPVVVDEQGARIVVRLDLVAWLLGAGDAIAECRDELRAERGDGVPLVFDARVDDGAECDAVEDLLEARLDGIGELEDEREDAAGGTDTTDD